MRSTARKLSQRSCISLSLPEAFTFDLTDRCHSRCLTCTKWRTPLEVAEKELTTQQWKEVILVMKEWLGEFHFIFAGGEPFLRNDIFELCKFAHENSVQCSVISNGFGFNPLIQKIITASFKQILISLNGNKAKTHDQTRGVEGAYCKTTDFIRKIIKVRKPPSDGGPELVINSILMPFNCEEAVDLVKWVKSEGLDGIRFQPLDPPGCFHPYPVSSSYLDSPKGAGGEWYLKNFEESAKQRIIPVINQLIKLKELGYPILNSTESFRRIEEYYTNFDKFRRVCHIGVVWFNVDPYGNVRFCFDMPPIGNILKTPPAKLYFSKRAVEMRRRIKDCRRKCHWAVF